LPSPSKKGTADSPKRRKLKTKKTSLLQNIPVTIEHIASPVVRKSKKKSVAPPKEDDPKIEPKDEPQDAPHHELKDEPMELPPSIPSMPPRGRANFRYSVSVPFAFLDDEEDDQEKEEGGDADEEKVEVLEDAANAEISPATPPSAHAPGGPGVKEDGSCAEAQPGTPCNSSFLTPALQGAGRELVLEIAVTPEPGGVFQPRIAGLPTLVVSEASDAAPSPLPTPLPVQSLASPLFSRQMEEKGIQANIPVQRGPQWNFRVGPLEPIRQHRGVRDPLLRRPRVVQVRTPLGTTSSTVQTSTAQTSIDSRQLSQTSRSSRGQPRDKGLRGDPRSKRPGSQSARQSPLGTRTTPRGPSRSGRLEPLTQTPRPKAHGPKKAARDPLPVYLADF